MSPRSIPGLAAAVGLDALADLAVSVLRPARLEVASLRHVSVRRLAVQGVRVRANDPCKAYVDHYPPRVLNVEPDAKAEEKDDRRGEDPGRPDGRERVRPPAYADPGAAREEVRQHG